jgi:hypothetical protein
MGQIKITDEITLEVARLKSEFVAFCKANDVPCLCIAGHPIVSAEGLILAISPSWFIKDPEQMYDMIDSLLQFIKDKNDERENS